MVRFGPEKKGFLLATASTFLAALTAIISKALVSDVSPLTLNASIYTSALLISLIYSAITLGKVRLYPRAALSGVSLSLYGAFLYLSFTLVKASVGGLAISLFPVITTFLSSVIYKERLRLRDELALLFSSSSIAMTTLTFNPLGVTLALLSSISLSIYTLLLKDGNEETLTSVLLGASLTSLALALAFNAPMKGFTRAIPLGLLSVVGTLLWIEAVKLAGPSKASMTALSFPAFVLLLSHALLGENVGTIEGIAYTFALASLILVLT